MTRSQSVIRICFMLLIFVLSGPAMAQTQTALVIGNSAYLHTDRLNNPRNDATEVAATLRRLGFNVLEGIDLAKPAMDEIIKKFAVALETSDAGLFFYAGHGIQINDRNFLLPVDAELISPAALEFELIRLDQIQAIMERLTPTNILIMDACRNNPLSRNLAKAMGTRSVRIGSGLAPTESGAGTLIAYSTQPGSLALDGAGRHSPFAEALLKFMGTKGDDLSSILINVRNDVMKTTFGKQIPWEHSALSRRFYFAPPEAVTETRSSLPLAPDKTDARLELELWTAVRDANSVQMLKTYLQRYPRGTFSGIAALKIAELEKKTASLGQAPVAAVPPANAPVADLGEALQRELKRVGCYAGAVDGDWGRASEAALAKFGASRGRSFASLEANQTNLEAVVSEQGRVCPLECRAGSFEKDGACIAKSPPRNTAPSAKKREPQWERDDDDDRRPRQQVQKKQKGPVFQLCMDSRNMMVDCNDGSVTIRR